MRYELCTRKRAIVEKSNALLQKITAFQFCFLSCSRKIARFVALNLQLWKKRHNFPIFKKKSISQKKKLIKSIEQPFPFRRIKTLFLDRSCSLTKSFGRLLTNSFVLTKSSKSTKKTISFLSRDLIKQRFN